MDAPQLFDPPHGSDLDGPLGAQLAPPVQPIARPPAPYPFASQHANQLLLLDLEPEGWVIAELVFDPQECRYAEVRRATYCWPREAIGALLSRALAVSETALIDTTEDLDRYLRRHYGFGLIDR